MTAALVRQADRDDVGTLAQLRRQWTEEWHGRHPDDEFSARFRQWFDDESHQRTFWVAELAGAAVGMVNLLVFARMPAPAQDAGGWGYLGNMFVLPAQRGVGIGRLLLDAVIAHADIEGLERVVLHPTERSVPFYRRAGFDTANQLLLRPRNQRL